MRSVDTNVLARFILADDQAQHAIATAVLAQPIWVTPTVWLELGWLLDKRFKLSRQAVADAMMALLSLETVHTAAPDRLAWAVDRYRSGADWADAMHLILSQGIVDRFATFDKGIARTMDIQGISIETLE